MELSIRHKAYGIRHTLTGTWHLVSVTWVQEKLFFHPQINKNYCQKRKNSLILRVEEVAILELDSVNEYLPPARFKSWNNMALEPVYKNDDSWQL